jgi:hypothetical protein
MSIYRSTEVLAAGVNLNDACTELLSQTHGLTDFKLTIDEVIDIMNAALIGEKTHTPARYTVPNAPNVEYEVTAYFVNPPFPFCDQFLYNVIRNLI